MSKPKRMESLAKLQINDPVERRALLKTALEHLNEAETKILNHLKQARFYIERALTK